MSGALLSIAIVQVLTILVGLLRAKGLALLLGPAGFGLVSTIDQVVVTLVTLGGLALPFTALKFMAHGHSEGMATFQRMGSGFLRLLLVLAVVTTVVASVIVALNPGLVGSDLVPWRRALQVAMLGVPSAMLLILFVNILASAQRPTAAAVVNLVGVSMLAAAAVVGAWWRGLDGLYFLSLTAAVCVTLAGLHYLARRFGIRLTAPHGGILVQLRTRPVIMGSAAAIYVAMVVYTLSLLSIRGVVLARLGAADAGLLQAALSVALTVGAILSPMSNLYLGPLVNRGIPALEKADAAHKFASEMVLFLLLGALPIVLFPGVLFDILFTSAFGPAASIIVLFIVWQCITQVGYVYQQLLIGLDDMAFMTLTTVLGYGSGALLAVAWVPWVGLGGAGAALATGMIIHGLASAARLHLHHGIAIPARVFGRLCFVIGAILAGHLLFAQLPELTLPGLGGRLAFGVGVILFAWWGLTPMERQHVRALPGELGERMRSARPQNSRTQS